MAKNLFEVQTIGLGPAGIGVLVADDRMGGELHKIRFAGIDPGPLGSGGLSGLRITSNSIAEDFFEGVRVDGRYAHVLGSEQAMLLESYAGNVVPLSLVGGFLGVLGQAVEKELDGSPSAVWSRRKVHHVEQMIMGESGTIYRSVDEFGQTIAESRAVVLAVGGGEVLDANLNRLSDCVLPSRMVLAGEADELLGEALSSKPNGRILIVGGSHSAFSTADEIIRAQGDVLHRDQIAIGHTSPIKVYYPSEVAAVEDGYIYNANDVCIETGKVNRFDGLRGRAKFLYQRLAQGVESRIVLLQYNGGFENLENIGEIAAVVQATGYEVRKVPIVDPGGRFIGPLNGGKRVRVDEQSRLLDNKGNLLPNGYAIGLGHGLLDGVNVFHGPVGQLIVGQLLANL